MLTRDQRLCANRDFQRVYRAGRSWAHPLLVLHVLAQPEGRRVGISVSKKVGGAVCRNRVKRRLREIVRARIGDWKPGFDAVLVIRAPAARAEFADLIQALEQLAQRSHITREPEGDPDALYIVPTGGRSRQARAT
jgi:ribonuclease P protein component